MFSAMEVGDVEAGVNEERITQDDFDGAGGAIDSGSLVARHDVSFDVPEDGRGLRQCSAWD